MADFRKVIKFGRNSLVISLPKKWVDFNGIQGGDSVMVDVLSHDLIISPGYSEDETQEERIATLDIDGDTLMTIKRKIMTAYIDNIDTIIIKGNQVAKQNKAIREIIHQLMALEIIEESPSRIVAKCFLNMADISLTNITHKTDAVIRTMFGDVITTLKDRKAFSGIDIAQNISERDGDVNRMTTLIARTIRYYLENPRAKWQGFDSGRILIQWDLSRKLEKIGDIIKRLARIIKTLDNVQNKDLLTILIKIEGHYEDVMKAYYKRDAKTGYLLENKKKNMMEIINTYQMRYDTDVHVAQAVQKVYDLFIRINEITYLIG